MKLIAKTDFSSVVLGNVKKDSELNVKEDQAKHLIDAGVCYEVKVNKPSPVVKKNKASKK